VEKLYFSLFSPILSLMSSLTSSLHLCPPFHHLLDFLLFCLLLLFSQTFLIFSFLHHLSLFLHLFLHHLHHCLSSFFLSFSYLLFLLHILSSLSIFSFILFLHFFFYIFSLGHHHLNLLLSLSFLLFHLC